MANFKDDFERFLNILNKNRVEYLIIGAYGTMLHTKVARATKDLDIWIRQDEENSTRMVKAIKNFAGVNIEPKAFLVKGQRLEIGEEPFKIEVWTSQEKISFNEAWEKKAKSYFGDVPVFLISREDLIVLKKFYGRTQDKWDLEYLEGENKH
ncbi:MAG: DUF6036 family nucleotidyltransferase [bacterium]